MLEVFKKIGITIKDENGNYRHMSKIIDELTNKWFLLTEEEQEIVREELGDFEM